MKGFVFEYVPTALSKSYLTHFAENMAKALAMFCDTTGLVLSSTPGKLEHPQKTEIIAAGKFSPWARFLNDFQAEPGYVLESKDRPELIFVNLSAEGGEEPPAMTLGEFLEMPLEEQNAATWEVIRKEESDNE
jgi:hypothetical protein